jgi:diketogulonate reductase-like aldo/keto reductase
MYGKAEDNIGLLKQKFPDLMENTFLATKVWTNGKKEGLAQIDSSFKKLNSDIIDLFQVHNLLDTETQMNTLREFRAKGFIRYLGITHYVASEFKRVEMFMKKEKVDFIQIPYSIFVRQAEDRLLAEAKDRKIAVIVNRPFEGGDVFDKFKNKPLDERLVKMGFESWAEVFMRFILAHPVVTCVLFASSNPTHVTENMNSAKKPTLTRQEADEAYNICKEYL